MCVFVDGPHISCESTSAYVGDRDVYLRCRVRAKPPPVALYWVLDYDNSSSSSSSDISSAVTRLSQAPAAASAAAGHYGQDYWTVATVRISDIISSLSLSLSMSSIVHISQYRRRQFPPGPPVVHPTTVEAWAGPSIDGPDRVLARWRNK